MLFAARSWRRARLFAMVGGLPDRTQLSEAPGGFDAERVPAVDESLRDDLWLVR